MSPRFTGSKTSGLTGEPLLPGWSPGKPPWMCQQKNSTYLVLGVPLQVSLATPRPGSPRRGVLLKHHYICNGAAPRKTQGESPSGCGARLPAFRRGSFGSLGEPHFIPTKYICLGQSAPQPLPQTPSQQSRPATGPSKEGSDKPSTHRPSPAACKPEVHPADDDR